MDTLLTFSREEEKALRQLGVSAVILFGSRARGLAAESSDYDIGVLRFPGAALEKALYEGIYDVISEKIHGLVNIDIVFLDQAPLELQMHVARFGQVLFEAKAGTFAAYKEQVIDCYADFAPIRSMFQQATLGRIPA